MSLFGFGGWFRSLFMVRLVLALPFLVSLAFFSGCSICRNRTKWESGDCDYATVLKEASVAPRVTRSCGLPPIVLPRDNDAAALGLACEAAKLEAACDPRCVDLYFAAAVRQWGKLAELGPMPTSDDLLHRARTYNAELAKLLTTAQRFGRIDAVNGLHVVHEGEMTAIPVAFYGFAWSPEDFNLLELVGDYELPKYIRKVRSDGVGAPLVVRRIRPADERFFRAIQPFAATAVLRPIAKLEPVPDQVSSGDEVSIGEDGVISEDGAIGDGRTYIPAASEFVLEFYNPGDNTHLFEMDARWKLARDLTAPLAWTKDAAPNSPITAFLRPDSADAKAQLVMLEPYQRGKIPVVFVHGIASDPTTWITMINTLRSHDWFRERYQAWAFRYPSGIPFLATAATLRRELDAAVALAPGAAEDPAVQQMVLIGHSMGGLVSKLQVTESGTALWDLVADRPLDAINADEADRERMREVFFFAPLPFVRQVIFIGTPFNGSSLASRGVGRLSSWAAITASDADERHRRVVRDNPGVFEPWLARGVPTSVDLLRPDHPLLEAMRCLDVAPDVQLHSIIGVADLRQYKGPGDGVVTLKSATERGVDSEKLVSETHEGLHEAASTAIEVERILQRHLMTLCEP